MSEVKAEWKNGRLYIDGEPLPAIFQASNPSQGSRITFVRLTPEESAVVEAAIAWREDERGIFGKTMTPLCDAVDALIASRAETKGSSQDDLTSEDRERVPREESK